MPRAVGTSVSCQQQNFRIIVGEQNCFSLKPGTQTLRDMLEVPQHGRMAGAYRRLAKLMAEWAGRQCGCETLRAAATRNGSAAMSATETGSRVQD